MLAFVTRFDAPFSVVGPEPLRTAAGELADRFRAARDPVGDAPQNGAGS